MNQCGSLLTRKNHRINGLKSQKYFLQRIFATLICESIPLIYLEGMLFPSIFYAMVPDYDFIIGSIHSSLSTGIKSIHGFSNIHYHVKSILTSVSIATITNPNYASYCYDKLTNLYLNHEDTRIVLNKGLTVDPKSSNGIGVICNNDSSIFESIDSKQTVGHSFAS